jgi:gliding motility-associated lipoprotein GldH
LIDYKGWQQQQELICKVLVHDSLSLFHIDITGRIQNSYFADSLSIIVQVTAPSGNFFCDTVSYGVTPSRYHLWQDFRFPWCSRIRFSETGTWHFSFRHKMEVEVLTGVMAIGVYINKM